MTNFSMQLNNFEVSIPESRDMGDGYAGLLHEQNYRIRLRNLNWQRECDAEVFIDGKSVGNFRLYKGGLLTLERPSNDTGKFTFYKSNTTEADAAGDAKLSNKNRGLVEVIFRPEKYTPPPVSVAPGGSCGSKRSLEHETEQVSCSTFVPASSNSTPIRGSQRMSAGMTGLSGTSGQQFYTVPDLDYDVSMETKIFVRLVHDNDRAGPMELKPASPMSTPVPAPVSA